MTSTPPNRAQRRASQFGRRRPGERAPKGHPLEGLFVLDNARPHEPGEKAGAHIKTLALFERLVSGAGDEDDFDHVAMVINIAKVRAIEIDATLADMIERAQDAMGRCKARQQRTGRFGFDGPGLTQTRDALDAAQAIIDASSPLQMHHARRVVIDTILGKGAWRRVEKMMGGMC